MFRDQLTLIGPKGRRYSISLAWPASTPPPKGWPTALVLDTPQFERLSARTLRLDSSAWPGALVGVGYVDPPARELDYPPCDEQAAPGGAQEYLDFLLHHILPATKQALSIDSRKLYLCGHSLGGLQVLYAAFHSCAVFQAFLISSPSVWWAQGQGVLQCWRHGRDFRQDRPVVRVTVGEYEQSLAPQERQLPAIERLSRHQRRLGRRMVDGARELADQLRECEGMQLSFEVLEGRTHADAGTESFERGWRLLLNQKAG